ncbi:MAG: hypothetical protein ACRDSK_25885 [Actinophytocola sp.]|uniref:hypothetical protein n=1 Tax=Actinophytocola sp. TaxID=1872138 RepID=UPI003D6B34C2
MTSPSQDEEAKALLARALADEPPLTLDRDAVFRQGRRKLRNRRVYSTGGAIAGVVATAVGAVLLAGPAAEEPPPVADRPDPPSTAVAEARAIALTRAIFELGVLPEDSELSRTDGESVRFTVAEDTYELKTDLKRHDAEGSLSVSIGAADPAVHVGCAELAAANAGCVGLKERGIHVAVGTWKDYETGEKRYIASAVRPDGTRVEVVVSNWSQRQREYGKGPADRIPVLDQKVLAKVATLPELRFQP